MYPSVRLLLTIAGLAVLACIAVGWSVLTAADKVSANSLPSRPELKPAGSQTAVTQDAPVVRPEPASPEASPTRYRLIEIWFNELPNTLWPAVAKAYEDEIITNDEFEIIQNLKDDAERKASKRRLKAKLENPDAQFRYYVPVAPLNDYPPAPPVPAYPVAPAAPAA